MLPLFLLIATALAAPGGSEKYPNETNPDPHAEDVALRFAWPAGMACEVILATTESVGTTQARVTTATTHLDVSTHAEGLLVHRTVTNFEAHNGAPGTDTEATVLLSRVAATIPDTILTTDGQFRRLENLAAYNASVTAALQPLLASPDAATAASAQSLATRLADVPALQSTVAAAWSRSIGFWPGITLIPGAHISRIGEAQPPFLLGAPIAWSYQALLTGPIACNVADAAKRCVQLEMSGTPSNRALRAALAQSGTSLLSPPPTGTARRSWSAARMSVRSILTLERDTLIPHAEVQQLTLYAEARGGPQKIHVLDLTERREETTVCTVPPK